jgi:hypothetical protein
MFLLYHMLLKIIYPSVFEIVNSVFIIFVMLSHGKIRIAIKRWSLLFLGMMAFLKFDIRSDFNY